MSKKSWHLDRRTFIRGLGVTCMLPFFEGMAMTSFSKGLAFLQKKVFTIKSGTGSPLKKGRDIRFPGP